MKAVEKSAQGTVVIGVAFSDSGRVLTVELLKSSGSQILDSSTVRFAKEHWSATPSMVRKFTRKDGHYYATTKVVFALPGTGSVAGSSPEENYPLLEAYCRKMNGAIERKWNRLSVLRWRQGTTRVRITVQSDGTVSTQPLDPPPSSNSQQLSNSVVLTAISDEAPFGKFSTEMKNEVARKEHNDGNSFTEDFSFVDPYGPK